MNPSMPNLVKIGMTKRDPALRARELGGVTGVPTPFVVIFQAYVNDCIQAEKYVHNILKDYRVTNAREFFEVDATTAIEAMQSAKLNFSIEENTKDFDFSSAINPSTEESVAPRKFYLRFPDIKNTKSYQYDDFASLK